MSKLREVDCGTYRTFSDFGRIVVRERVDGLFDVIHIRHTRTSTGMHKSESPCGVFRELQTAKLAAYALARELSGAW